jgi:CPA2 family monovalent cation:H+ antiporter-2
MDILQPFSAIYVLILAILGPILTKQSPHVYAFMNRWFKFKDRRVPKEEAL